MTTLVSPSSSTVPDLPTAERVRLREAITAHYDFVWRGLCRLGLSEDDASDAAQEVFVVMSSKIGSIAPGAEKSWLYRTVSGVGANYRRRRTRQSARTDDGDLEIHPDPQPTPESRADTSAKLRLLDALLAELPDELRDVVVLCELESMTLSEAASVLEIPQGTVASRLRRARTALSAAISKLGISEP